ncbi:MAG: hypothetical protein A2287_06020 [Candidatus Melainabacteria bacterium RIFOXYA12_FULL_32_12]|nr:MAG: hypothetical protein A2255_04430 [Candidatus Melainabacteria bacterium RIFOXYA2_FULL_32_9]OGI27374.1 MAG: hypothetical protein A2287_06020 [Candidatus Melainabacteria bacterium RIFOXYA12_FULL_32_12]
MNSSLLNIDTTALLIIDIQEKLLKAQFEQEKIIKNVSILAETAKILDIPVIISEQYPQGLGFTIKEIKEKLPENTDFFEKTSFNCCLESGFTDQIHRINRKQILICGMEAHICVHQTVHSLISLGYDVHIIQDAVTSRKQSEYEYGLKRMISYGAIPNCTEMAIFELIKCAKHPQFKSIQNLVK